MSGQAWLDALLLSVSLFNVMLLLWLGLTVLLNAQRRTPGLWLAGAGLLTGAAFFVSHSAILGIGIEQDSESLEFWWRLGWAPVIVLPWAWYALILWYAGYWDRAQLRVSRLQLLGLASTLFLGMGLVGLLTLTRALPPLSLTTRVQPSPSSFQSLFALVLGYPVFCIACIGLSLAALTRPARAARVMGERARQRARPWLMATSLVLLVVSLMVAGAMVWGASTPDAALQFGAFALYDLTAELLVAVAVVLLGQAIIAYEVFTGKVLPRRGFASHWARAVILAGGFSALLGAALSLRLHPVYSLLLSSAIVTTFYALVSWRSYAERERAMAQLRPFVTHQRLVEQLLSTATDTPLQHDATRPFAALCREVLGARWACLVPVGPLAPLLDSPLTYPPKATIPNLDWPQVIRTLGDGPEPPLCIPFDAGPIDGEWWGIPLWSERGLIGLLQLSEKADGGLYTQEEMELARESGARLLDTYASAELARRLMALQRERLVDSQVQDRRVRRTLHDEVLPLLHAALILLDGRTNGMQTVGDKLADTYRKIADLLHDMPVPAPSATAGGLLPALHMLLEQDLAGAFDNVRWVIQPQGEHAAQELTPSIAEVVYYAAREALRNAAQHARGGDSARPLHLTIGLLWKDGLQLAIEDDGVGLHTRPGPSALGGRGLALHSTMMAVIGGTLAADSTNAHARITLHVPQSSLVFLKSTPPAK